MTTRNRSTLFSAFEKIFLEAMARRVASVDFYLAGNMSEFEVDLGNLLNAIDGMIRQSEGFSQWKTSK
jgi:hypothetical protein